MQQFLYLTLSVAIIVITILFIMLSKRIMRELENLGRTSTEMSELIRKVDKEIMPLTQSASAAIDDIDALVVQVTKTAKKIDKVAGGAERLLDTAHVASAATKAASSAAAEVISVYEGVKRGIKSLRGS